MNLTMLEEHARRYGSEIAASALSAHAATVRREALELLTAPTQERVALGIVRAGSALRMLGLPPDLENAAAGELLAAVSKLLDSASTAMLKAAAQAALDEQEPVGNA